MEWLKIAQNDWYVYQDPSRIKKYLEFQKISTEQYEEITGEPY